jgi:hypothetical protein
MNSENGSFFLKLFHSLNERYVYKIFVIYIKHKMSELQIDTRESTRLR